MSVTFAREYVRRMRALGVRVDEHPGCYSRGNGQTSAYRGPLTHHTGAPFDGGFWILVNGRSDLRGPLCNVCTWADGHQTLIAAHPANHAGAAGGSWARPYPDTRNFNRMVWGNEIMYPGSRPMTAAQYRTALIGAGVAVMIAHGLRTLDELERFLEWARLHGETSLTGKWDAGYAPGRMIDRHQFRRDIVPAMRAASPTQPGGIETMAFTDEYTDWAGNKQTVKSWMDNLDKRLYEVHVQERNAYDYSRHHNADEDNQYGHTLATRSEMHKLVAELNTKLDAVLLKLGEDGPKA